MSEFPMLDKIEATRIESEIINRFLDWVHGVKKWKLCRPSQVDLFTLPFLFPPSNTGKYSPLELLTECILAEYFKIDLKQAEKEKEAIIKNWRHESIKEARRRENK